MVSALEVAISISNTSIYKALVPTVEQDYPKSTSVTPVDEAEVANKPSAKPGTGAIKTQKEEEKKPLTKSKEKTRTGYGWVYGFLA